MRYRKKTVVIEAIQLKEDNIDELEKFCDKISFDLIEYKYLNDKEATKVLLSAVIKTLEGDMTALVGDYIIKGVNGEFYPCKPDIFKKTYELVE